MKEKTIDEVISEYNLEFERVINEIKKSKAKIVLLQFPDGLKIYATAITDYLSEKTNAKFIIWFGSCYGACDLPVLGKELNKKIDLLVQFGHNQKMPNY